MFLESFRKCCQRDGTYHIAAMLIMLRSSSYFWFIFTGYCFAEMFFCCAFMFGLHLLRTVPIQHVASKPLLARGRTVLYISTWHTATAMNVNANIPDSHREVVRCWPKEVKSDQVKELMRAARMLSRRFYALSWRAFEHTLLASCISVAALLMQCARNSDKAYDNIQAKIVDPVSRL